MLPPPSKRLMNLTFQDLLYKCMTVYLDDILVFSKNLDRAPAALTAGI